MAYLDNKGLLHGRCGGKVYSVRNNQQVVRDLPKKRTTPPTEAQVLQRKKFASAVKLSTTFKPIFQFFRCPYLKNGTGKFTAHILKNVLVMSGNKITFDYSNLVLLKNGGLLPHSIKSFSSIFPKTITLELFTDKDNRVLPNTKIGLIIYSPKFKKMQNILVPELSSKTQAIFRFDEDFIDCEIHCWYYCYIANREWDFPIKDTNYSSSKYLGKIRV